MEGGHHAPTEPPFQVAVKPRRVVGLLHPSLLLLPCAPSVGAQTQGYDGHPWDGLKCRQRGLPVPARPRFGVQKQSQVWSQLPGAGHWAGAAGLLPARRKMLTEGKACSQRRVCWHGVAQAGSPEGVWGAHREMPDGTSQLPGTPQPCPACWGTAWLHPSLETSSKAMATSPGVALPLMGTSPNSHPSGWDSLGMQHRRARSSVAAGCGMVLTLDLALGGCQCIQRPLRVPPVGSWSCFRPSPPALRRRGCREGEHWLGQPPAPTALSPARPWGGGESPPLTRAPLCLSGQDYGLSRPPPQFGSIYHVRGNGTLQHPLPGGGERRMLSTGQDQSVPVPNWGSFPQPIAYP